MTDETRGGAPGKRSEIAAWALYDAANSAFPLVIVTAVYVLYFKAVIVGGDDTGKSDFLWGLCISKLAAAVALTSPFLGAIADARQWRKQFLGGYTVVAVFATLLLSFAKPGMVAFAMATFILANAAFEGGMVFYASLLPSVAPVEKTGRVSGIGWATGYIGGLVCLFGCLGLVTGDNPNVPMVVRVVAAWFAVFSIPTFLIVKDRAPPVTREHGVLEDLKQTIQMAWRQHDVRRFLLAYFLYNDAIITIFAFSAPFAKDEPGYETAAIIKLVMGVQVTGAIGAFGLGMFADRLGNARTVFITLCLWVVVTMLAFSTAFDPLWSADSLTLRKTLFGIIGLTAGLAMGATQSASRAFLASVVPQEHSARFFGLYAIAGRFSAIIGPTLFGAVSLATGSKAWSVLTLAAMFAIGLVLVRVIDETRARDALHAESVAES